MTTKTRQALLARGLNSRSIDNVLAAGHTLSNLKLQSRETLQDLGLDTREIKAVYDGARPPIPFSAATKVLYDSKLMCCVCRNQSKPYVIHHLESWAKSKDHSENNLVVLCLDHHDLAHTTHQLSLSLTPNRLRALKAKWLDSARYSDAKAVLGLAEIDDARWDYINIRRLFELATRLGIALTSHHGFQQLVDYGMVDPSGHLVPHERWPLIRPKHSLYDLGAGNVLYLYTSSVLDSVIRSLPLVDLTNRWTKSEITTLVEPSTWIALQTSFFFKNLSKEIEGRNQDRRGRKRRRGVKSNSASMHGRRHRRRRKEYS